MPLLNKQKFVKNAIPDDLDPSEEVFFSKLTLEIFRDYDEYFERTILCNSLVWTCSLSGKTGLTYAEAVESEERAARLIENFPPALLRPILFLITLTRRGNIKDLVDDIFTYTKDRYFIGETCLLVSSQTTVSKNEGPKQCRIVEVIVPSNGGATEDALGTTDSQTGKRNSSGAIDSSQIKYVVEMISGGKGGPSMNGSNGGGGRQTLRFNQLCRTKNQLTKEKIYIITRLYCEAASNSMWQLSEQAAVRFRVAELRFEHMFAGEPPHFEHTFGRGQHSRSHQNQSKSSPTSQNKNNASTTSKTPTSNNKTTTSSATTTANSKKTSQQHQNHQHHQNLHHNQTSAAQQHHKNKTTQNSSSSATTHNNSHNKKAVTSNPAPATSASKADTSDDESKIGFSKDPNSDVNLFAQRIVQILEKKVADMDEEEFEIWRDYTPDDEDKELRQLEIELEKVVRREEKEREKERIKNEKNKQKEYLKELKKPKEDLECDNLVELPKPVPIKSKITQEMFGDCIMILEFLNHFGDLFELKDDFPNGFNFDLLENALFSKSCDSALCNLLLFFLDSVFKCFDEETFDDSGAESDDDSSDEDNGAESDDEDLELNEFYHEPHKDSDDRDTIAQQADTYSHKIKSIQGRSLKSIGLDVYTISEMLRLYFMTSGTTHTSKIKYWYQQRGGYTHMDECGIDFVLNDKLILNKLERMNVFELEPVEKLKILTCLCHQLVSHLRFRDYIEDNFQKLNTTRSQLRDLQTEENRRMREEASERWRRKMNAKEKEKARALELAAAATAATAAASSSTSSMTSTTTGAANTAASTTTTGANNNKPASKESSTLLNEMLAREEEMAKIAEEKFNNECAKKRDEFLRKEAKLLDEIYDLQTIYSMCPLGKDRYFRRYWVFKSLPGVFVEDDDEDDGEFERMMHEGLVAVKNEPECTDGHGEGCGGQTGGEATASTSTNQGAGSTVATTVLLESVKSGVNNSNNNISANDGKENKPSLLTVSETSVGSNNDNQANDDVKLNMGLSSNKSSSFVKGETKWCFFYTAEMIDQLIGTLNERGLRESELKQNLSDFRQRIIDQLDKSTSAIVNNLTMSPEDIERSLRNCLKENVYNVLANSQAQNNQTNTTKAKKQSAASIAKQQQQQQAQIAADEISCHQHMEIDLRDKLLDISEQISIGALGTLKVSDRFKWRECIERGEYEPMCVNLVWGDLVRPAGECTNGPKKSTKQLLTGSLLNPDPDLTIAAVNNFAKILLQIEQSVEKRFIQMPLGDQTKSGSSASSGKRSGTLEPSSSSSNLSTSGAGAGGVGSGSGGGSGANGATGSTSNGGDAHHSHKTTLQIWERSLAECTTLSQLFVHLQTLDESITWSKSILNARCCMCKKKRDADKMLLCDKCDRGHHLYCLRPALSAVPEGEWFCPKCRPKDVEKTPRKIRESFGDIYSDGDASSSNHAVNDNDESNDTYSKKRRGGGGMVNGNSKSNNSSSKNKQHHDDEDDESLDENEDTEAEELHVVVKKGRGKAAPAKASTTTTATTMNGHHKTVNFHSDEDATEDDEDNKRRSSTRTKKKIVAVVDKGSANTKATATRSNNKISSSSLTSVASSTNSSNNSTSDLKSAASNSTRTTRNNRAARATTTTYMETSDDLSANGTDDDSAQPRSKRAKKSEEKIFGVNNNTSSRNTEMAHRLKLVEKILNDIMKSPDAWPFLKPVSKRKAPGYFDHIKTPMDFSTIKNNINNFKYSDYTKIIGDIRLIFENCWTYNEPGSEISEQGKRLSKYFEQQAKAAGLLDYSNNI